MNEARRQTLFIFARPFAVASGLFVLMLACLLGYNVVRGKVSTLVNSRQVVQLHDELRSRPKDEALKVRIRQLDLQLRQDTFYRLQLSHDASRALLAGLVVFLASAQFVRIFRRRLPDPQAWGARKVGEEQRATKLARYAVIGIVTVITTTAITIALQPPSLPERVPISLTTSTDPLTPAVAALPAYPSADEMQNQWPSFRGPHGLGVAPKADVPVTWDAKTGTNIRWKTAIPLHGLSSPVVWNNAVFLTGADKTQSSVFRLDTDTGALQWTATIKLPGGARPPTPQVGEDTSLAAPTPVTDGRRVYALFPTGEIAAFDFAGRQVWARNIGPLDNSYGYAASLAIHQDRLLIQIDRGQPEDGKSRLLALDTLTGRQRWEVRREVAGSWSSPVVFDIDGQPQLITCANPFVISYNPIDGNELWRSKCLESDVAPSPIMAGNMIVAIAPNTAIIGLRCGAATASWQSEAGVPDAVSPVSDGRRVYCISGGGLLTCYALQSGKVIWTHDLEDSFYASPTIAGNVLILVSRKGTSWVIEPGDAYKELGRGALGEECCASPVPLGKRLLLRGKNTLFCIESK